MNRARLIAVLATVVLALSACAGGRWIGNDGSTVVVPPCALPTAQPTAPTVITCSATYSPPPTTTTIAPSTTTTTTAPPPGGFPSPQTTGAPTGQVFTEHPGDVTVTTPGEVIDGWHVTGRLLVNAPNVTVKNSWVEGYLDNEATALGAARLTVRDTTVGPTSGCNDDPGVGEHDYTALRVRITNHGDGFRVSGSNVTVQDSFVQTCDSVQNHDDGMQVYCPAPPLPQPCRNVIMNHNTLSVANTQDFTAPLFGGSDPGGSNGQLADSAFTSNLLWGGVFSVYLTGSGLDIEHNRVDTNRWVIPTGQTCAELNPGYGTDTPQGCAYDGWVYASSSVSCATATWIDNRAVTVDASWQVTSTGASLDCR